MSLIGILDVGIGNVGSLNSAVYELGFDACLIDNPDLVSNCDSIILPGVGAFSYGINAIKDAGLLESINAHADKKKPLLGICLGMQLLFSHGYEGGKTKGLNLVHGTVKQFKGGPSLNLPHVGWNEVTQLQSHPIFQGVKTEVDFYFVHSYRVECDPEYIIGSTEYGESFPSVVSSGNVIGVQFHPEKSQKNGLRMLENFCLWDGKC
jgi:glutamine amidotransferase